MTQAATVPGGTTLYIAQTNVFNRPHQLASARVKELSKLFTTQSTFKYNNSLQLTLKLNDEWRAYFILVKGLIEFNRSAEFKFQYSTQDQTVSLTIDTHAENRLAALFTEVEKQLKAELKFKSHLKRAIEFEKQYKLAQAHIYPFAN